VYAFENLNYILEFKIHPKKLAKFMQCFQLLYFGLAERHSVEKIVEEILFKNVE
jgi:hypothetical protein